MLLVERGGGLLRQALQATVETWRLPICRRSSGRHQPLHRRDKPNAKALHMDRRPGQNHRCRQTRASSVRFDPLALRADRQNSGDCQRQRNERGGENDTGTGEMRLEQRK